MATSDSEAFESADEDINEEDTSKAKTINQIKTQSKEIKSVRTELSGDEIPHGSDAQKPKQKHEKGKKPSEAMKLGVKLDKNETVKQIEVKSEPQNSENVDEGWEDFDVEENIELEDDLGNEPIKDKIIETKDKPIVKETKKSDEQQEDEGWEFDDWGDEDVQTHVAPKTEAVHSEKEFKDLADKLSSLGDPEVKSSNEEQSSWGGWGGWGASLISSGVSQLTSHVSQSLNTVTNVIESGIGAPTPEEILGMQKQAKLRREEQTAKNLSAANETSDEGVSKLDKDEEEVKTDTEAAGGFQFGKLVSSVTKLVETTGTTVITGGLDTLEEIGKRTMKVIQGDEPGGRVKLSTLLREAKDKKEEQDLSNTSGDIIKKKSPRFEVLFDDYQGLVHLEALEMLSKQCDIKIQTLINKSKDKELKELQETLEQVKEICELPENDEEFDNKHDFETFKQHLNNVTKDMGVQLSFDSILTCWQEIFNQSEEQVETPEGVENLDETIEDLSFLAIRKMAQYSALSVQSLHKCAALLSVRERRSTADEADGLTQLTVILSHNIGEIASLFSNKLNKLSDDQNKTASAMTNVYLEAEKGSSYIKDAFLLTIPILQVGAT